MKRKLFRYILVSTFVCTSLISNIKVQAMNNSIDKIADNSKEYEVIRFGDLNNTELANYSSDIEQYEDLYIKNHSQDKEVIEKLKAMEDYYILKTMTDDNYEVALAYSDGSYQYLDSTDNYEEAVEIAENYDSKDEIPTIINEKGQVIYATNAMGRVFNHRDGEPIFGSSEITYLYGTASAVNAYTYINQGYINDVPIIETSGTRTKIQASGYKGWIDSDYNSDSYDLVVVPTNQVSNPSYYYVEEGSLYHYISYNMTADNRKGYDIRIGVAPSYLKNGVNYYSYDGIYFYQGTSIEDGLNRLITDLQNNSTINAVNGSNPNYNYYGYLPYRTKSNYTASDLNKFINENTESDSKLRGLGDALIEGQEKYGVNPIITLAIAINESAWGTSSIAQEKNNLFGINAIDSSPGQSANTFNTPSDCVREFTKNYISTGYADPDDYRYFGGYLGNKELGSNVKYASDPFWGEKAAQHAYTIDISLSGSNISSLIDYNGYQLAVFIGANQIVDKNSNLLYNINSSVSGWGGYPGNICAFKFTDKSNNGMYEIFPDRTDSISLGEYSGNYNWNDTGFINGSNFKIVNNPSSPFIPGYSIEDIDKNGVIDINDLSKIALQYNVLSNESGYKDLFDLNYDNIIDIFDLILISKNL